LPATVLKPSLKANVLSSKSHRALKVHRLLTLNLFNSSQILKKPADAGFLLVF